jgi:rod shape determining protein RodA
MPLDRRILYHFDWQIVVLTMILALTGMLAVISAAHHGPHHHGLPPLVLRQLVWIGVGAVVMTLAALFDYRALSSYSYVIYLATLVVLGLVLLTGHSTGGARRWLNLGVIELEPSELVKLALIIVSAQLLKERPQPGGLRLRHLVAPAMFLAVPTLMIAKEPDLGSALLLVLVFGTLVFAAGLNLRTLGAILLAVALAAPVAWHYLKPYQRERIVSFIDPQADPLGAGYHIIQSEIAVGSGGPWGKGFLQGTQGRLNFLPEQTTDFIFAVFAEEFGFAGSLALLAVYALLIWHGLWIARQTRDRFGALLALGVVATVFWQVTINIGMAAGILPVVGITLPLVSYGGSSLIVMMAELGLLISVNVRRFLF